MRKAYIRTAVLIGATGGALAGLWIAGIAPALHLTGWHLVVTDVCAGWVAGVASFKVFEPWLDKLDRANAYIREMKAIMQRDQERSRV